MDQDVVNHSALIVECRWDQFAIAKLLCVGGGSLHSVSVMCRRQVRGVVVIDLFIDQRHIVVG